MSMNTSFHGGSNETIGGRVRLRRPELLLFWFEVVLGRLWMRLFMVVPMTPSAAASDPGGRRNCCLFAVVVDTGKLFFGGAVETGDKVAQRHWRIESPANIS